MPQGYVHDETRTLLGRGDDAWRAAKAALQQWAMFPENWTRVHLRPSPVEGAQVMVSFRLLGLWWAAPARIVYTLDEPDRFGFAYGTLPGHLAHGEESFSVERNARGEVFYVLRAFSRPSFWGARLLPAFMRAQQRRFQRESAAAMQRWVAEWTAATPPQPQRKPAAPAHSPAA